MEDYSGRILAERYRLPLPPSDAYELIETRAFDTRSGQEVLVRQVPLPEVVDAELLDGTRGGPSAVPGGRRVPQGELPAVRRAIEAAQAAASVPDHPRLDQVFDVFAEGGSLWIVSELVPARPLAALIADEPLSPYRAAEVAADVLTALRVLHAHGWTHRNITMRTVLICEDGRVVLTGLAAGAAEDALCGYDPVPPRDGADPWPGGEPGGGPGGGAGAAAGRAESGGGYGGGSGYGDGSRAALTGPGGDAGYGGSWNGASADAGYGEGAGQGFGPGTGPGGGQRGAELGERYDDAYGGGSGDRSGRDGGGAGAGTTVQRGGNAAEYAPLVAPGYDTGPRYRDHISPGTGGGPEGSGTYTSTPGAPSAPGVSGIYGVSDNPGVSGTYGVPGTPGESGTPGTPGLSDTQGAPGIPGLSGTQGTTGTPGLSGTPGATGAPGLSGNTPGAPGLSGTSAPGAPGLSGTAGAPGTTGVPGASGGPGASGALAPSGSPRAPGDSGVPGAAGDRPDLKAAARAGAIAAYRAGAQAAARITEQRKAGSGAEPAPEPEAEPRPAGSKVPQGYSYPYGGPDSGATWHGATPRRQALPPAEAEPAARAVLPAQLALPQGYHQADAPDTGTPRAAADGQPHPQEGGERGPGYGQSSHGPGHPDQDQAGLDRPVAREGTGYDGQLQLGPGRPAPAGPDHGAPQGAAGYAAAPGAGGYGQGGRQSGPHGGAGYPAAPGARGPGQTAPQTGPQGNPQGAAGYPPPSGAGGSGWGSGPRSGLDAERARQTRMAVVGAVTERWAPEQAQAVHGPWQLAAPVGPATDLWGLGALLYRAVQGHAPYPEDSVAELVEMICAEPPAFAEECGPLRPVVESLLRQDPTERPDFEELRGWLRSLVRSAPEPDGGFAMLPPVVQDPARLPVTRRRADLHGRHRSAEHPRKPRSLGRSLLLGILVLLSGAVAYALFFMPRSGDPQGGGQKAAGMKPPAATQSQGKNPSPGPSPKPSGSGQAPSPSASAPESKPAPQPGVPAPSGYTAQQDAEHFSINVPNGWERRGMNESGQVRFTEGDFVLTVVPGRDKVQGNPDPATYQKDKEPELAPYRSSTWSSVSDIRSTKVGNQLRVTGRYTWIDGNGRSVVARNFVVALGGSYHVVMVTGPQDQEGKVTEVFEQATASYKSGG
ncbi:hypothetical protein [Streptomyces sp. NBC_01264]|uniref:hypothetical protein n=1 Tax=Streptomyces sp. NBC_01264 TaxID=2903804 RepID=UPI00225A550F|nr:hypothetical protein [Streptomyces sp. NBC_01264]MCX4780513.1 hypothetical protein [Streptomyces sp. NBC_01264]